MSTEINYEELVGQPAKDHGIEAIDKKANYRIDDEGIIRKKKEMLSDAEFQMMDAKAFGIYVFDQYLKNTKSEERVAKVQTARAYLMENMEEAPLKLMGVLPEIGEDELGWFAKGSVNGMQMGIGAQKSKEEAISAWNKTARAMA